MGTEGALTKDNPQRSNRDLTIAHQRLEGKTYSQLAKEHGISKARISQILNDKEIKDVLETGTKQLVSFIPKVVDNYKSFLNSNDEKIQLDASRDIAKITGISPGHTVNQFFLNIYNNTQVNMLDPRLQGVLSNISNDLGDTGDIIEVEPKNE